MLGRTVVRKDHAACADENYIYKQMYIYMIIYMCISIHMCICVIYTCIHVCVYALHACIHVCLCLCICIRTFHIQRRVDFGRGGGPVMPALSDETLARRRQVSIDPQVPGGNREVSATTDPIQKRQGKC